MKQKAKTNTALALVFKTVCHMTYVLRLLQITSDTPQPPMTLPLAPGFTGPASW